MFRPRHIPADTRRGVILLVVLALLTLFAIVGISFVLYANSHASSSRFAREGEAPTQPDMEPEMLLSFFLGQLIYDVDDINGVFSSMRGHSLARTMYGLYGNIKQVNPPPSLPQVVVQNTDNIVAYSGLGRIHFTDPVTRRDDYNHPNYMWFKSQPQGRPEPLRDPERLGQPRTSPLQNYSDPIHSYIGFNVPYTYPDLNNMFLASVKAGSLTIGSQPPLPPGVVLMPSFHRPWLFGPLDQGGNPNWTNVEGKYMILRPRPADMAMSPNGAPLFPYPEDLGGDVKNLAGSPGTLVQDAQGNMRLANNDSIWMDLGAPVMIAPDGTKYKPLFAPLIIDLDGRLNLNIHGNMRGQNNTSASNQGWGPWEVNPRYVLDQAPSMGLPGTLEWSNLFLGLTSPPQLGRYGPDRQPTSLFPGGNIAIPGTAPHSYAPVDFDGCNGNRAPSDPLNLSWTANMNPNAGYYQGFDPLTNQPTYFCPNYPCRPDGNKLTGWDNGSPAERMSHPLLFNFFNPQTDPANPATNYDLVFPISNMEALLRYGDTNSPGLTSALYRLCNNNFDPNSSSDRNAAANAPKRRNLVTTHSFNLDRPGGMPWVWNAADTLGAMTTARYELPGTNPITDPTNPSYPVANPIPFDVRNRYRPLPGSGGNANGPGQGTEFGTDWRSVTAALSKVNLNRELTPYPIDTANPYVPFTDPSKTAQFQQAQSDRQNFAKDIWLSLVAATGAYPPYNNGNLPQPTLKQLRALRWLAQLAVNIVDYIDSDDIMTPFPWASTGELQFLAGVQANQSQLAGPSGYTPYVFGTELPRVAINEVYAEFQEQTKNSDRYNVDVWVELYNGLRGDVAAADPNGGTAILQMPPTGGPSAIKVYRLEIVEPQRAGYRYNDIRDVNNVLGDPPADTGGTAMLKTVNVDITGTNQAGSYTTVHPAGGQYLTLNGNPKLPPRLRNQSNDRGFFVLGPNKDFPHTGNPSDQTGPGATWPVASNKQSGMSYTVSLPPPTPPDSTTNKTRPNSPGYTPMLLLRRLPCPYLPATGPTGSNPYVTVDYWATSSQSSEWAPFTPNNATVDHTWDTSPSPNGPGPRDVPARQSSGRVWNPYCATVNQAQSQNPADDKQPQHSFFRHNAPGKTQPGPDAASQGSLHLPFDWLAHMDRQLISPMELLMVSAWKPHELTHQFFYQGKANAHMAHWFDQRTRLYRVFELLETAPRGLGTAVGGRIPGAVNLNSVWDEEILQALCDANAANNFSTNDVHAIFQQLIALRNPNIQRQQPPFGPNDRPFLSFLTGYTGSQSQQYPRPIGINDTILRAVVDNATDATGGETQPRLFQPFTNTMGTFQEVPQRHPYLKYQLLTKLFNNVTTRSNVFAVWVTVGFFKVEDDTTFPVKLGAEIGKAENRHVRHRMFAIVDRSNLTVMDNPNSPVQNGPGGPPILLAGTYLGPDPDTDPTYRGKPTIAFTGATYNNGTLTGSYEGIPWTITPYQSNHNNGLLRIGYGNDPITGAARDGQPVQVLRVARSPDNYTRTPDYVTLANLPNPPAPRTGVLVRPVWAGKPGNPGPVQTWPPPSPNVFSPGPHFDPRAFPWVVRYFSVIN